MNRNSHRFIGWASVVSALLAWNVSTGFALASPEIMPVDQIRPGMKGIGKSVFQGTQVEDFQVEIIDILRNFAPQHDLILAEIAGKHVDEAGVIAGMSGSPVYIDGKLIGAVSYRFGAFPKRPIAGITPIEDMLELLDMPTGGHGTGNVPHDEPSPSAAPATRSVSPCMVPSNDCVLDPLGSAGDRSRDMPAIPLEMPVSIGGAHPQVLQMFKPVLNRLGFQPVLSSSGSGEVSAANLEPGSAVSAQMVSGDLNMSATGTLTYIHEGRLLAFGHAFMWSGPTRIPLAPSRVLLVVPGQATSFKMTVDGEPVGAWTIDQSAGIAGALRETAPQIGVRVRMDKGRTYQFQLIDHPDLTALLLQMVVGNSILLTTGTGKPLTIETRGSVSLRGREPIPIHGFHSGDLALAETLGGLAGTVGWLIRNPYQPVVIDGVDMDIEVRKTQETAAIERVRLARDEFRPADTIMLNATLRVDLGRPQSIEVPFKLPENLAPGVYTLWIGSADRAEQYDAAELGGPGTTLDLVLDHIRKEYDSRNLFVRLLKPSHSLKAGGRKLNHLPPSVEDLLESGRDRVHTSEMRTSIVREKIQRTSLALQGEKAFDVTVRPALR